MTAEEKWRQVQPEQKPRSAPRLPSVEKGESQGLNPRSSVPIPGKILARKHQTRGQKYLEKNADAQKHTSEIAFPLLTIMLETEKISATNLITFLYPASHLRQRLF